MNVHQEKIVPLQDILHISDVAGTYSCLSQCSPSISQLYINGMNPELLIDRNAHRRVGIIGTRDATTAGLNDARRIAQVVSSHGGIVVSGMALGIDGAAHLGALDVSGETIAVLGSGVDVIYPNSHEKMAKEIASKGCIISEFDCGTSALPWHFPIRNRIIAALSEIIVVPEGTLKGGARITVDLALAMGKTVCAIPGPRRNRASELPKAIIKDGALCITDPSDVIHEMGIDSENVGWELNNPIPNSNVLEISPQASKLLAQLAHCPLSCHDVAHLCKYTEKESLRLLSTLEQLGRVRYRRGMYEIT